jgi:hypothetical protein
MKFELTRDLFIVNAKAIEEVLRKAFRAAVIEHARLGFSVPDWQNGQVVHVSPEQILADISQSNNGA